MKITKAKGNLAFEINNKPAWEGFKEVYEIIDKEEGDFLVKEFENPIEAIESIVRRHPMREEQVFQVFRNFDKTDLEKALELLIKSNRVMINKYKGTNFIKCIGKNLPKNKSQEVKNPFRIRTGSWGCSLRTRRGADYCSDYDTPRLINSGSSYGKDQGFRQGLCRGRGQWN